MQFDPFLVSKQMAAQPDPFLLAQEFSAIQATSAGVLGSARNATWTGERFPGGFGVTHINTLDYWTLRQRSAQVFTENLYARGIVRRFVTNVVNIGLSLEAEPNAGLLSGLTEEQADEWSEDVENRFEVYGDTPRICDYTRKHTLAELQNIVYNESLVEGDTLVVLKTHARTNLPQVELIRGGRVANPFDRRKLSKKNKTVHGVEIDSKGRDVGYWVNDKRRNTSKFVPAIGSRTGKRTAWLVFGTDKRLDEVRGVPLLSILLQSLRELDRYRDNELRASVVNSLLAMMVTKGQPVMGTRPLSGGAVRNTTAVVGETSTGAREFGIAEQWPGIVIEELQYGEEPKSFDTKRPNVDFGAFEEAVIASIAWATEMPPEILKLSFSSNYSASKAAINEFRMFITARRKQFGLQFLQPLYCEWLIGEVLTDRIAADGFLEAWRNPALYVEFGAWLRSTWSGPVKPSVDLGKDVTAYVDAIEANLTTHDRAAKDLFGVRHSRVLKRLSKERAAIREASDELGPDPNAPAIEPAADPPLSEAMRKGVLRLVQDSIEELAADGER